MLPDRMSFSVSSSKHRRLALLAATLLVAVLAVLAVRMVTGAQRADAAVYYFDNVFGDDVAAGYSEKTPRRSLDRLWDVDLRPGDSVMLRAGTVWSEQLYIEASGTAERPIKIGTYGDGAPARITGDQNCVVVTGDWVAIRGVHADGCQMAGFELHGTGDSVRDSRATNNAIGVFAVKGSIGARISDNYIAGNNRMYTLTRSPRWDDAGALGVLLQGANAVVDHNTIKNQSAFSYDFGRDGSAIEIYGATDSLIHHNTATNNQTFVELGLDGTKDNSITFNRVKSSKPRADGLVTRGAQERFGPVAGTDFSHNRVTLRGHKSTGFTCSAGCSRKILSLFYNVFDVNGNGGFADRPPKMRGNRFLDGELDIESRR